jgi:hypothetical protein
VSLAVAQNGTGSRQEYKFGQRRYHRDGGRDSEGGTFIGPLRRRGYAAEMDDLENKGFEGVDI